ncbi:MAG: hypothetical protein FJW40_05995 [Acidobacteria bacterium]|nr:hypothetical protein [Acidobacteriota bacterium]
MISFDQATVHRKAWRGPRRDPMGVCLEEAMDNIDTVERETLLEYHAAEGPGKADERLKLALRLNVSINNLRVIVLRVKKSLKTLIERCLDRRYPA